MAKRSSGKIALVLVVVLAAAGAGVAWFLTNQPDTSAPSAPKVDPDDPDRELTEEERAAYLSEHCRLEGLTIAPDTRPDDKEVIVPGLMRVSGTLFNEGSRKLHKAFVHIYPKDETGKVLGSFVENVASKRGPLAPGDSRAFSFTIPDKKGFAGEFGHSLR